METKVGQTIAIATQANLVIDTQVNPARTIMPSSSLLIQKILASA